MPTIVISLKNPIKRNDFYQRIYMQVVWGILPKRRASRTLRGRVAWQDIKIHTPDVAARLGV